MPSQEGLARAALTCGYLLDLVSRCLLCFASPEPESRVPLKCRLAREPVKLHDQNASEQNAPFRSVQGRVPRQSVSPPIPVESSTLPTATRQLRLVARSQGMICLQRKCPLETRRAESAGEDPCHTV